MWFTKTHLPLENKLALITGASQGLGSELAAQLYEKNCSVVLVSRRANKLSEQVEAIVKKHGKKDTVTITYLAVDVCDYDQCVNMWKTLASDKRDPDYFFSCVGGAICKLFPDLTQAELSKGVQTDYLSTLYPVHAGVKQVIKSNETLERSAYKKRHIIIFSSAAAVYPLIGYSQYAPLKSALMSLSLTLRQELSPFNYRVSCVLPGNFQSEGFEEEEKTKPVITKKIEGASTPIAVDKCAQGILTSLDRGYDIVYTDLIGWVLGSASLGAHPRVLAFFQIIISLVFSMVAPIVSLFIDSDISSFFREQDKKRK
ncbi:3-dehydrosphinganine reductase [Yamadazyma tenuis]|uniref:3-ketodihydrosphingosine reductase TSC10 n=1 Tax=Candida tenuis (strain ATCC 10573 / BCRC 21748 / CBS 615 / JCM 9827 / NBRC 10315 / NRRL Y-1498 / VKM Y-70) TaxID=590646 RepID=G3B519_CANTC|nr:3-ketodihydrosphingosine reductase TSC10 [Yamadazyma tenuis ATCC 10573]EGV63114.1 3-ketodihydrosphingosine reductase TSC10 [Yamadazyma tenuis ATCC 10573]WEJ97069.1 3-dehydrosphinganine reductase [Yamadazyma tenuis]